MMSHSPKILIVDDVAANQVTLSALLEGPEVELLTAASARAALELLLVHDVAVALVDVRMPDIDGYELAALMRGSSRTRSVPIIFVTGRPADRRRPFRGYEAGAVDFLEKPIEPVVLRSKVDVFLALYRQKVQLAEQVELLREALTYNERFAAVLGHDLGNPLQAILTNARVLGERTDGDDQTREVANRIVKSSRRMSGLIEQLLEVVRARSGAVPIRPRATDFRTLCEAVVAETAAVSGGMVEITMEGDPHGSWDPDRLFQVVSNLLTNALRHGRPSRPVEVCIDGTRHEELRFSVRNEGPIPPAIVPHVFEPFRSFGSERSETHGLGLGLFIVRSVVEAHGGKIDVRSDENRTRFDVRLPRVSSGVGSGAIRASGGTAGPTPGNDEMRRS